MRRYALLFAAEFRRQSTYRLALLAGIFTNAVFGLIRVSILQAAVHGAGGQLGGYDATRANSYVWLGQALLAAVSIYAWSDVALRVRSGEVAIDLARPIDFQLSYWVRDLGRAALQTLTRGLPILVLAELLVGLVIPHALIAVPLGLLSLVLAVSISFLGRFGVNLIAFWTVDAQGFIGLYALLGSLLCGLFVPVHLFPPWLKLIADVSPFPSMFQSPIDVLSGQVGGAAAIGVLGRQVGWLIGLLVLTRLIMWRAGRRLVVQGG